MFELSIGAIIEKIDSEALFAARVAGGGFSIVIEKYVPFICTAIHHGSGMDKKMNDLCLLNKQDRWREEDPLTGDFIGSLPIRMIAHDSRYEYDLNRRLEDAVYEEAWGKSVWVYELSALEKEQSYKKHRAFYTVLKALVSKIERKFGGVIIYDIHSYNYQRGKIHNDYPVFNLGTDQVDKKRYSKYVTKFIKELEKIKFKNIENVVRENEVFYGRGYLAEFVMETFNNVVVLPLEIKKIYCDEQTGDVFPSVVETITEGLKKAIIASSLYFNNNETKYRVSNEANLLSNVDDPVLVSVDKKMYSLLKNFESLVYVNPKNLETTRELFYKSGYKKLPNFKYKSLKIDPYELKKHLYQLPISDMQDVSIQLLYKEIIREYSVTIDLLSSRGTDEFLYNSLKLYGRPSKRDVRNANLIIQSYGKEDEQKDYLEKEEIFNLFLDELKKWNMGGKIIFGKNMPGRIMVNSTKKTLIINEKAKFTDQDIKLLSQHEIGLHMLTTINASYQPLKFIALGTPNNVETQEGLAVLAEFLTGDRHVARLKELAYRVIAVDLVVKGRDFKEIFDYFMDEYDFERDQAFNLTSRVLRGGGFTKDHLYLRGFIKVYKYFLLGKSLQELLVGKTSIEYSGLLNELISRGYLKAPHYRNDIFANGKIDDEIIEYILKSTQ